MAPLRTSSCPASRTSWRISIPTRSEEQDMRELRVHRLGRVPYGEALAMQRALVDDRRADRIPDTLLLLQHPHVLTLGAKLAAARAHVVAAPGELAARGVEVFEAGRGGDVTYHGPGQLVAYPI